jgi:hypothetical protein
VARIHGTAAAFCLDQSGRVFLVIAGQQNKRKAVNQFLRDDSGLRRSWFCFTGASIASWLLKLDWLVELRRRKSAGPTKQSWHQAQTDPVM